MGMVLTGPPPTISDSTDPTSPRRSFWSAPASRPAASCGGTATRRRELGLSSSGPRPGIPSPTTGISTRERRSNNPLTTRSSRDLAKTSTRQSSGPPLLGSRSPHHHHHRLLPWPTSGEWEQKPRCCYSYLSFTSLQLGFYSQSSVVFKFRREFHVKNVFCFRLSFLSHFPIILLLFLFCIELLPIIYIILISIVFYFALISMIFKEYKFSLKME